MNFFKKKRKPTLINRVEEAKRRQAKYWTELDIWSWRHWALCNEARTYDQLLRLQSIMNAKADLNDKEVSWTFFNSRLVLKVKSLEIRVNALCG